MLRSLVREEKPEIFPFSFATRLNLSLFGFVVFVLGRVFGRCPWEVDIRARRRTVDKIKRTGIGYVALILGKLKIKSLNGHCLLWVKQASWFARNITWQTRDMARGRGQKLETKGKEGIKAWGVYGLGSSMDLCATVFLHLQLKIPLPGRHTERTRESL